MDLKSDRRQIGLAAIFPLLLLFLCYLIKVWELGMDWDFTRLGVYPLALKGVPGILISPLIHGSFTHLFANTLPLFFLGWCLFFFYREIAPYLLLALWIGSGFLTFLIGKPAWHIGASGLIYGLAFFLFFSGILRKHTPLVAISLLVTFLYGGLVWNMLPYFAAADTSWEGHLSGAISGTLCAFAFSGFGPQREELFSEEEEENEEGERSEADEAWAERDEEAEAEAPTTE